MKSTRAMFIGACLLGLILLSSCSRASEPDPNAAKPSNPGGTGKALSLTGNPDNGAAIFKSKCSECHGEEGKGGIENSGSTDGTVPSLNPAEEDIYNSNPGVFAANLDLFIEHGSVPEGTPTRIMLPFGDSQLLQPQEIADVISYIVRLNTK